MINLLTPLFSCACWQEPSVAGLTFQGERRLLEIPGICATRESGCPFLDSAWAFSNAFWTSLLSGPPGRTDQEFRARASYAESAFRMKWTLSLRLSSHFDSHRAPTSLAIVSPGLFPQWLTAVYAHQLWAKNLYFTGILSSSVAVALAFGPEGLGKWALGCWGLYFLNFQYFFVWLNSWIFAQKIACFWSENLKMLRLPTSAKTPWILKPPKNPL